MQCPQKWKPKQKLVIHHRFFPYKSIALFRRKLFRILQPPPSTHGRRFHAYVTLALMPAYLSPPNTVWTTSHWFRLERVGLQHPPGTLTVRSPTGT